MFVHLMFDLNEIGENIFKKYKNLIENFNSNIFEEEKIDKG